MVANYGFIRSGMWDEVVADIRAVTDVARPAGVLVKVILETAYLTLDEIKRAVACAIEAQADFVKTSEGEGHARSSPGQDQGQGGRRHPRSGASREVHRDGSGAHWQWLHLHQGPL